MKDQDEVVVRTRCISSKAGCKVEVCNRETFYGRGNTRLTRVRTNLHRWVRSLGELIQLGDTDDTTQFGVWHTPPQISLCR